MRQFRGPIVAGLIVANLLVWALAAYSLLQSREQYELRARNQTQNVALAIDLSVSNTIARIDLLLRATADELERQLAAGGIDETRMNTFLARQELRVPEVEAVRVARADGRVILGKGLNKAERPSWADRDYFIHQREHPDAGLIMSPPRMGRVAKKYIVGFSRRYNHADGGFAGVISAPLALDHFTDLIAKFDLGKGGAVVLRDTNLGLITRHPPLPTDDPAGAVGHQGVSTQLRDLIAAGTSTATYYTPRSADGNARIISFRRARTVPMFMLSGVASSDYLEDWRREVFATVAMAAAFLLLSGLSGVFLAKLLGRMQRDLRERQALEERERRRRSSHQRLNEVAAFGHLPLREQLHRALQVGADHLRLEFGIVSHVDGATYRILAQVSPPGILRDGQEFPLGDTYCSITLARNEVVAIADMGNSEDKGHPCYKAFRLETYIGAPLLVSGRVYGTVNFSSPRPYHRDFSDGDREFVNLLARWAGSAIERDATQKQLMESELYLKAIVENEPECVKLVAPDGTLQHMNRAGLEMIEASEPGQAIGRSVFGLVAPESRASFVAMHEKVLAGAPATLEFEVIGLRGGRHWMETHAVPLRDADGRVTAHLAVTRDVTVRRRTEAALREAMHRAEAANEAKSRFLATMSHEIRTPLNGILGMAQLLLLPGLSEAESRNCANTILGSGQTLLTLLNDILDLSKVDAGKLELTNEAFDPAVLVADTAALHRGVADNKRLGLDCAWIGPAGGRYRGDPVRLRQMLSNLISNAIKFTDTGGIRVEAHEIARDADGALLAFSVTDTGIGIRDDQRGLLFQPFSQLDGSSTRRHGGTGLGLSIVRRLAELMGGSVEVDSEPGRGSTFRFIVRVVPVDGASAPMRPAAPDQPSGTAKAGGRILVVEDNEINMHVINAFLRRKGYTVLAAENGRVGVELATVDTLRPDLVLMDCQMPEMNGFEATQAIRAWEAANGKPRLPIIAVTAGAYQEDRDHCLASGMDDFIAKPVDLGELAARLNRYCPTTAV